MENRKTISVVLPIKSSQSSFFEDLFSRSIQSVKNQKDYVDELIIVYCNETNLTNHIKNYDYGDLNVVLKEWKEEPNFCSQINLGFESANSEWVSFIEFDDEYSNIWFKNFNTYSNIYKDVNAFLPIVVDVNDKGVFIGFTNEATFAANFSQEMGYLTNETLQNYQNFQISGMILKKETFLDIGKFKTNIKLTFGYEFLLRLTDKSGKIMSIPKIGYKHMNFREGSIFWNYKNGSDVMSDDEVKFWVDSAKKEYHYTSQRDIKYEPQEV
jgi:hypothetical protein